jgi:DNA-binding phage protein
MTNFTPFDPADYLDSEEAITEYLNASLEDSTPNMLKCAVEDVARARIKHGLETKELEVS